MISSRVSKNMTCCICLVKKNKLIKFGDHSFAQLTRCMAYLQSTYLDDEKQTRELDDK